MGQFLLKMKVNGKDVALEIDPRLRLLDVLRDNLKLTGTKEGCSEGECGACSVLLDGELVDSCLVMAAQANGCEVVTIEGVAQNGELDPLQQAFLEAGAVQCGYCIPGMVLAAKALLDRNPSPTRRQIGRAISGNICRCTGYKKIVDGVELAVKKLEAKEGVARG